VYSLPPTKGIPAAVKNCIFGDGVSVTFIGSSPFAGYYFASGY